MIRSDIKVACEHVSILGECPVWDVEAGELYWIDSLSGTLFRQQADGTLTHWTADQEIGSFALRRSSGAVCALRDGIYTLSFQSGAFERLAQTPNDPTCTRLNDGKCDRQGRFWVGSLTERGGHADGVLYRIGPDGSVTTVLRDIVVSNGLAFPVNGDFFYHSDSRIGRIYRVEAGADADGPYKRSLFFQTPVDVERPDGAALDEHGCYWSALYGGAAIARLSPKGEEVFRIDLPTAYPTMVAFGGEGLRTLFITTARDAGMSASTENDPYAGKLLSLDVDVAGLPEPRFAGA
ncbi:MAG: SMP-30/gluconolactonase/LRE family protein [Pseudomonadota bacterium]